MTIAEVLGRMQAVRRAGNGHVARCPAHDDRHASLSIGPGKDGRVLLNCHAGCSPDQVADALGIKLKDLFAEERRREDPEATFDYRDEKGRLLYQVVRMPGKKFLQRRPDGDGWSWKLGDVRRVIYRLPEVLASAVDEVPVYVVEGEKDVETLRQLGLVATSNSGGAGKWQREFGESLRGRDVVILPDNDQTGHDHAEEVAKSLDGIAVRVRVVALPSLPPKGDVSDWLVGRLEPRGELELIVSLAPAWPEKPAAPQEEDGFLSSADRIEGLVEQVAKRAKSSLPFHVGFLDDIAVGTLETDLVVLGAPTGAGKTTLAATFALHAAEVGSRVAYFALEAHEGEIEQRMLYRVMSRMAWKRYAAERRELDAFTYKRWCHGKCDAIVAKVAADAKAELRQKTKSLRTFYRSGEFKTDDLVSMIRRVKADLIILDHLHFLDDGDEDEVRAMGRRVKAVSDAILGARIPVIAIAHLRKTDTKSKRVIPHIAEFHGSSEITKIATIVVTLAPAEDRERKSPWIADTYMHVSKDRSEGEQNYTAVLGFDRRESTYVKTYDLGRLVVNGTKWEEIPFPDLPWWSVNERRRQL